MIRPGNGLFTDLSVPVVPDTGSCYKIITHSLDFFMKGLDSFSYKSRGLYFTSFYKLASFYKITKAQVSPSGS